MKKKVIIIISCIILVLLIGGCLFYKNPEIELAKMEQELKKIEFKEINTHQFELLKEGLSQEEYLKSKKIPKSTNSIIFDTYSSIITENEEETIDDNASTSISLVLDLKELKLSGYYSINSEITDDFVTAEYDLTTNSFKCDNNSNCDLLKNKMMDLIDETYIILNACHKNINDFK